MAKGKLAVAGVVALAIVAGLGLFVLVWCERFGVNFATAPLASAE